MKENTNRKINKGGEAIRQKSLRAQETYYKNPKLCENCKESLNYHKRLYQKFCSHSCRAKVHNKRRSIYAKYNCLHCGKGYEQSIRLKFPKKFCNKLCDISFKKEGVYSKYLALFQKGELHPRWIIRKILLRKNPYCWKCGIAKWKGKKLSLQVDHKDGNPGNDLPKNVRLLCPNCHSITPYFGGRNRGNGRKSRGLPVN